MTCPEHKLIEWLKFSIPVVLCMAALASCFMLLFDCRLGISIDTKWRYGILSYSDTESSCAFYSKDEGATILVVSQTRALAMAVIPLGLMTWIGLLLTPFCKYLNGVWGRICLITASLVVGNLQLLTVIMFLKKLLATFPVCRALPSAYAVLSRGGCKMRLHQTK